MDFSRLIKRYGRTLQVDIKAKGSYIGGRFVKGVNTQVDVFGVLLTLKDDDIKKAEGEYTTKDKKFLTFDDVAIDIDEGQAFLDYSGDVYKFDLKYDYDGFSKTYKYLLKQVID